MKIILILLALVILGGGLTIGLGGFGTGDGSADGKQSLDVLAEEVEVSEEIEGKEVIIKVEENKIFIGEEECTGIEDLRDRISRISSQEGDTKFIFEHEYAIKATYDEVKQTLIDLEEILEISIDYKE